jgi:1-acyl-sn-glycerol-3-phosphate acyltransferase
VAGLLSHASRALGGLASELLPSGVRELGQEIEQRLREAPLKLNEYGFDPYGLHPDQASRYLLASAILYRYYFRVETHDVDNVPAGRVLVVANHAGQFAYDGMNLSVALLLEARPPRLARGMSEYFFWKLPWVSRMAARIGTMVGTPENCVSMLNAEECVMVFPEGARGANKPFRKRYQLQRFGDGFMRLALETGAPIVPVGIVGSEEQQPGLANFEGLGRSIGLPSLPITVTAPWFGPLGYMAALPVKYRIYFGEPLRPEGEPHEEDAIIEKKVDAVKAAMRKLLERGLRERSGIFS